MGESNDRFYILWNPNHPTTPKLQYPTHGAAHKAAHEMAAKHGGTFYVCEAIGKYVGEMKVTKTGLRIRG